MSTSVERAEVLYDGGGSEEEIRANWRDDRLDVLCNSAGQAMEALDNEQCRDLLERILCDRKRIGVDDIIAQYMDHVVEEEEQRGAFDQWLRDQEANAADLANDAERERA
jgi:hypothetical protein